MILLIITQLPTLFLKVFLEHLCHIDNIAKGTSLYSNKIKYFQIKSFTKHSKVIIVCMSVNVNLFKVA